MCIHVFQCPDKPNITNSVVCSNCGGAGHIARDCRQNKQRDEMGPSSGGNGGGNSGGGGGGGGGGGDRAKIDEEVSEGRKLFQALPHYVQKVIEVDWQQI